MVDLQTMVRTEVIINGRSSFLAQGQDLEDLQRRIEAAVATTGTFVAFTVVGNRDVRVLISPRTDVVFAVDTVQFDPRDTGDVQVPYGGFHDL